AAAGQPVRCQIEIRGMVCPACAFLIEARLRTSPGVTVASVDFAARRATVVYDSNRVGPKGLQQVVEHAGYRVVAGDQSEDEARARRVELLRVALAWLAMTSVVMLAAPAYLARPGEI